MFSQLPKYAFEESKADGDPDLLWLTAVPQNRGDVVAAVEKGNNTAAASLPIPMPPTPLLLPGPAAGSAAAACFSLSLPLASEMLSAVEVWSGVVGETDEAKE